VSFSSLSNVERNTIRQCIQAILHGDWVDDYEFATRLGFERELLRQILSNWPLVKDSADSLVCLAINNCMNEVRHGISISKSD
jgi:hypothetical protein